MPQLKLNRFIEYELSAEEEIIGSTYNELQVAVLQNELAIVANAKLNLKYDANNPSAFLQEEAELQGKMGILSWLLERHKTSQKDYLRIQDEIAKQQQQE